MTSCGKLFKSLMPATGKAQSPMVTSRVGRTVSKADDDEARQSVLYSSVQFSNNIYVSRKSNNSGL